MEKLTKSSNGQWRLEETSKDTLSKADQVKHGAWAPTPRTYPQAGTPAPVVAPSPTDTVPPASGPAPSEAKYPQPLAGAGGAAEDAKANHDRSWTEAHAWLPHADAMNPAQKQLVNRHLHHSYNAALGGFKLAPLTREEFESAGQKHIPIGGTRVVVPKE